MFDMGYMQMIDFLFIAHGERSNLIAFNEIKGHWTYPKKGFIQWKNDELNLKTNLESLLGKKRK